LNDAERKLKERARREGLFERQVVCPACRNLCVPLAYDGTKEVGWACSICPGPQVVPRTSYEVEA
jgi:hypothetical protein